MWSWTRYGDEVGLCGRSLLALGVQQFGSVALLGCNSPQWFCAAVAACTVGAKAAGVYTTHGPDAVAYVLQHCQARQITKAAKKTSGIWQELA